MKIKWKSALVGGVACSATLLQAPLAHASSPVVGTMNDAGGVYYRSDANWNTPVQTSGFGIYPGTVVQEICVKIGAANVPGSSNDAWTWVNHVSGPGYGSGFVSEHMLNDGAPINQAPAGVPACGTPAPPAGTMINGINVGTPQNNWHQWGNCNVRDYNGGPHGWVIASTTAGMHIVRNGMLYGWFDNGGAPGRLSCPTSDEYGYANGARQDFQGGSLYWHSGMGDAVRVSATALTAMNHATQYVGGNAYNGACLQFVFDMYGQALLRSEVNYSINGNTYPVDIWGHFTRGSTGGGTPPPGALVFYAASNGNRTNSHVTLSLGGSWSVSSSDGVSNSVHYETLAQHSYARYLGWWLPAS